MFNSKRLLSGLAATMAATLFLSGCGGSSNTVNPTPFFIFPTVTTQFAFVANLNDTPNDITEFVLTPSTGTLANGTPVSGSASSQFTVSNGFVSGTTTPSPAQIEGVTQFGGLLLVAVDATSGATTTANGAVATSAGLIVLSVDPTTGIVTQENAAATPTFDATANPGAPGIGETNLNSIVACNDPVTAGVVDVFILNNADAFCSMENYTVNSSTFAVTATSSNFDFANDCENVAISTVGTSQVVVAAGDTFNTGIHSVFGFAVGANATLTQPTNSVATVTGNEPEGVGLLPSQGSNTVASGVSGDDTNVINEFTVDASGNIVVGGSDTVDPNNDAPGFTGVNFAAPVGGSIELMLTTEDSTNNVIAIPTTIGTGLPVPNIAGAVLATTAVATGTNGSTVTDQSTTPVELVTSSDTVLGTPDAGNVSSFIFPNGVFDATPQTGSSGGSEPVFVTSKPTHHHH